MKKLLILGGTGSSIEIVYEANNQGYYTIVADDRLTGPAKMIADEAVQISTTDTESLVEIIHQREIDGVFTGPSEFNIKNCMNVAEKANLTFYCDREQWDLCSNKLSFKRLCERYSVPVVPTYTIRKDIGLEDLSDLEFPVIVKPVDAASSRGIRVCNNADEVRHAYQEAQQISPSGEALIEHYFEDYCCGFSSHYIIVDGRVHLSLTSDKYIVDQRNMIHITTSAIFPSRYSDDYIDRLDSNVRRMIEGIGIKNGVCFLQAIVHENNFYFHEMGLRLSGGLVSKFTDAKQGVNTIAMMVRNAVGDPMSTLDEEQRISPFFGGEILGSLSLPLRPGIVSSIRGIDSIKSQEQFIDFMQNYQIGDEMKEENFGTLMQLFGRIKFSAQDRFEAANFIDWLQDQIFVLDNKGKDLIYCYFDTSRLFHD